MGKKGLRSILILDDDADFRKLVMTFLGKMFEGVDLAEYDPLERGVPDDHFDWSVYDVLLLDYYLCIHGVTGLDILQMNRKNRNFPATLMLTGAGNEEVAVRAIKAGVYEYLRKESLDKEHLRNAILNAHERHQSDRERQSELTNQSRAFNKALFYQQLEGKDVEDEEDVRDRVFLIIELDEADVLEERLGMILRDNIVRHIAKQSFEVFRSGNCNPRITRLSDSSVALLIDDPHEAKTLNFNMQGLCRFLKKSPYRFEDNKFRFTVSIGVLPLPTPRGNAEELIRMARTAGDIAAREEGNTFHIWTPGDEEVAAEAVTEVPEPEAAAQPAPEAAEPETAPAGPPPEPETEVIRGAPAVFSSPDDLKVDVDVAASAEGAATESVSIDETIGASSLEAITPPKDEAAEPPESPDGTLTPEPESGADGTVDAQAEPEPVETPEPAAPGDLSLEPAPEDESAAPRDEPPPSPPSEPHTDLSLEPASGDEPAAPSAEKPADEPPPSPPPEPETQVIRGKPAEFSRPDDLPMDVDLSAGDGDKPDIEETIGASSLEAITPPPAADAKAEEPEPAAETKEPEPTPVVAPSALPPAPEAKPAAPAAAPASPAGKPAAAEPKPAPAARPAAPPRKPAAKAPERDDAGLKDSDLDETGLRIKRAFDDKRAVQLFQPVISLTAEGESEEELYRVSVQVIDSNGILMEGEEVISRISTPAFQKFVDRWMLRETFGRVVNSEIRGNSFLLHLSHASLGDPGLFNWLRKMFSNLTARDPGKSLVLEFSADGLTKLTKPAEALMSYLRKSHGFRFALGEISSVQDALAILDRLRFDLLRLTCDQVRELQAMPVPSGQEGVIQRLSDKGTEIVADGISDATSLTDAIGLGVPYAMGEFIGEATAQLDETTNVESFEIT